MNRKLALTLVLACAVAAMVLPSAAAPWTDTVSDDLALQPTTGQNGAYAYYEDDELVLGFGPSNPNVDAEGVPAGTVTPFDRVFTVTNTDSEAGRVWLTADTDAILFYDNTTQTDSVTGEANAVTLDPGETLFIGVLVDATDQNAEASTAFTLHAEPVEPATTGTPTATPMPAPTATSTTTTSTTTTTTSTTTTTTSTTTTTTSTPTDTPTRTPTADTPTRTPTADTPTRTPTARGPDREDKSTTTPTPTSLPTGNVGNGGIDVGDEDTPTPEQSRGAFGSPPFALAIALLALLAAAVMVVLFGRSRPS